MRFSVAFAFLSSKGKVKKRSWIRKRNESGPNFRNSNHQNQRREIYIIQSTIGKCDWHSAPDLPPFVPYRWISCATISARQNLISQSHLLFGKVPFNSKFRNQFLSQRFYQKISILYIKIAFADSWKFFNVALNCMQHSVIHIHHSDINVKRSEYALTFCLDSMKDEKRTSLSIANFIPEKSEFQAEIRWLWQSVLNLHTTIRNEVRLISYLQKSLNAELSKKLELTEKPRHNESDFLDCPEYLYNFIYWDMYDSCSIQFR